MKEEKITKTVYVTEDGQRFNVKDIALEHENELNKAKKWKAAEENVYVKTDAGAIIRKKDVLKFFNGLKCDNCPFGKECDRMYDTIRACSTDTFSLCSAIKDLL